MEESGDPLVELVNQLTRLPGIGERTATRLAFFLLDAPAELSDELGDTIRRVRARVRRCSVCGTLTDRECCRLCGASTRDRSRICVVEGTADVAAIERTGEFNGLYHVLHGLIRPLDGVGPDELNLRSLIGRLGSGDVAELVIATNPSVEGETTAIYIRNLASPLGVRVTRIAAGIPLGGEIEYADRATLGRAIQARQPLS